MVNLPLNVISINFARQKGIAPGEISGRRLHYSCAGVCIRSLRVSTGESGTRQHGIMARRLSHPGKSGITGRGLAPESGHL
jgi:hypothetical protein